MIGLCKVTSVFSAKFHVRVTSSLPLDSPNLTLSETQTDKFCQSPLVFDFLSFLGDLGVSAVE